MGAVSQVFDQGSKIVANVVQDTSNALTGALQPVEKALNQGVTDVGKTIANSPALEGAITVIAASYGVPPAATAAFLAANKTSQTGGNLEKGLETLVLSYGAGKYLTSGIDLSSPAAIDQSVAQAQAAAPTALADVGAAAAPAAIADAGAAAAPVASSAITGTSLGELGAVTPVGAAVPAAGISANEAVAAGMSPGAAGATAAAAGALTPAEAAAAAGTVGAGSALADVAAAGNTAALAAGTIGAGSLLGGLSGTQLAALGTGAAGLYNASATRQAMQDALGYQQGATAASQKTLGDIYNQQLQYQAPYQAAGVGAVNQIADMNPYLTHQFNAADLQAGLAPNYDFMLQQGQQANQRAANVGGGALGGNALTGLNQFTQNYAGNAYQNAFNNYQTQRTGIYNTLANIAGIGQTANTGAGLAGQNYSQGTVGLNTGLANAQAASTIGQSQATSGGISNLANTAFLATLLGQKG